MNRALTIILPFAVALAGCSGDEIVPDVEGVSVSSTELNDDIAALQVLYSGIASGLQVQSVSDGTVTFTDGSVAQVTARTAYDFSYTNPSIGITSGYWTVGGRTFSTKVQDELISLKGENGIWYVGAGGRWTGIADILPGSSSPVFKSFSYDDDAVDVILGDGTILTAERYTGDDAMSLSSSAVSFGKEGGSATVSLTSNKDWTATVSDSWISVSATSGVASGSSLPVSVSVDANSSASRSGKVTFKGEYLSVVLTVLQEGENGGGTISSDDKEDSEDNVANTTFDRTIYITYSSGGKATVTGDGNGIVSISGNDVTVNNTTGEKIIYELSGTTDDGFFKLYSSNKQALILNGAHITNRSGAAINIQGKKRSFIVVRGTNTLADGASYTDTPSDEDEKAAFFSEGQLIFSGSGKLTVTATGKAGITSDDYVRFMSAPTVKVSSSAGHGIRGKDAVYVSNGTLTVSVSANMKKGMTSDSLVQFDGGETTIVVSGSAAYDSEDQEYTGTAGIKADENFVMNDGVLTITNSGTGGKGISGDATGYFNGGTVTVTTTGSNYGSSSSGGGRFGPGGGSSSSSNSVSAKGIKFDGNLYFAGATVTVRCRSHEAIESKGTLDITGGTVFGYSTADDAINSASHMTISGGHVYAVSTANDGMDANGNLYIKGGVVYAMGANSPEVAIDANTEGGYKLYVQGGTIIAFGSLESGTSFSQGNVSASFTRGSNYALYDGNTLLMAFKAPSSGSTSVMNLSHPTLKSGTSYTLKSGVTLTGGTSYFDGYYFDNPTVSGGSSTSLKASASSGSGGGWGPGGR